MPGKENSYKGDRFVIVGWQVLPDQFAKFDIQGQSSQLKNISTGCLIVKWWKLNGSEG